MNSTLSEALTLSVVGVTIVFMVLGLLALVVGFIARFDREWQSREIAQDEAKLKAEPTIDATTLVLITAAIGTYLGGRYRVRSVRRLPSTDARSAAWSTMGRAVLMGSHRLPHNPDGQGWRN